MHDDYANLVETYVYHEQNGSGKCLYINAIHSRSGQILQLLSSVRYLCSLSPSLTRTNSELEELATLSALLLDTVVRVIVIDGGSQNESVASEFPEGYGVVQVEISPNHTHPKRPGQRSQDAIIVKK